jgi:glycosyltransferase involved in cell wall biosynthesis
MPMTRICFVGLETLPVLSREYNRHGVGGEQVQHALLARAFARQGADVSVVCLDYGQPDGIRVDGVAVFKSYRREAGIPVLRFISPRLTGLWSALRRADADVYYTSCAGMQVGVVAAFARLHGRASCFRVAHDSDCDPSRLLIQYRRDKWLYEFGLRRANAILAQSEQQQRALKRNYGVDSRVAGMLVEPPLRQPAFAARDIDVLWVNNIRPFKRPDLALELARRMPAVTVHMVGGAQPGEQALYERIEVDARSLPNVVFHGRVPYHDVNALYERARVFVNTSDSEGFPNSYLQAWRRGTPVVAFFDPDAIIARHALGAAPQDLDGMTDAVAGLWADAERWTACSQACTRFMDEHFSEARILRSYSEVFERLAAASRRQKEVAT